MRVVASNCGCCGIKHIRDFPYNPADTTYISKDSGHDEDQCTTTPEAYTNWDEVIWEDQLMKPAGDIFKALVKQIKERRPAGLITLNLAAETSDDWCCEDCNGPRPTDDFDEKQVNNWRPIFEELGFKEETFMNSNSGNRVHHFTLAYDDGDWEA